MKTIIIGFSKHRGFAIGSWLIRLVLQRPFSHTYFKYKEPEYQDGTVFHAVGKGLIYISETSFLEHNEPVSEFNLSISDDSFAGLMQECHKIAGRDYGYLQNIGIALIRWANKIGFNIKHNPLNDGINCSEWAADVIEEVYGKWTDKDPNLIAPDDVYKYLVSLNK